MTVKTWEPGMPERPCGGCTMCCKLPEAPAPLNKPAGTWCQHCDKGRGCQIYDARPKGCRDFMCLWKVMPDFPEELRPDKCKVMWVMGADGIATAVTEYPEALKRRPQQELAARFRAAGVPVRGVRT